MKKYLSLALLLALVTTASAHAFVTAMPGFYDFGSLTKGSASATTIWFQNMDNQSVNNFWVTCNDYTGEFDCFSSCFNLAPYSSCPVTVWFRPYRGDNSLVSMQVQGMGPGEFATSYVQGVDRAK
jgi:hypothetical protein